MKLLNVEGESFEKVANVVRTMLPKLERGLEVPSGEPNWLLSAASMEWWALLFNVLHHTPISAWAFGAAPKGPFCPSRPRRLVEIQSKEQFTFRECSIE